MLLKSINIDPFYKDNYSGIKLFSRRQEINFLQLTFSNIHLAGDKKLRIYDYYGSCNGLENCMDSLDVPPTYEFRSLISSTKKT